MISRRATKKIKMKLSKNIILMIAGFTAICMLRTSSAVAECVDYYYLGQCPNFTPNSPGDCQTCETYYTYTSLNRFWSEGDIGVCQDPYQFDLNVSYIKHVNANGNQMCLMVVPRCNYVPYELTAPCRTVGCGDLCGGG